MMLQKAQGAAGQRHCETLRPGTQRREYGDLARRKPSHYSSKTSQRQRRASQIICDAQRHCSSAHVKPDTRDIRRSSTNGELLPIILPCQLVHRSGMFILEHEFAILFYTTIHTSASHERRDSRTSERRGERGRDETRRNETTRRRKTQAYLDVPNVHLAIIGSRREVRPQPRRERDRVDKVGVACEGMQARPSVGVPELGSRVERGSDKDSHREIRTSAKTPFPRPMPTPNDDSRSK
jgi:hypothetical protein